MEFFSETNGLFGLEKQLIMDNEHHVITRHYAGTDSSSTASLMSFNDDADSEMVALGALECGGLLQGWDGTQETDLRRWDITDILYCESSRCWSLPCMNVCPIPDRVVLQENYTVTPPPLQKSSPAATSCLRLKTYASDTNATDVFAALEVRWLIVA
jgi:hypothetical protein